MLQRYRPVKYPENIIVQPERSQNEMYIFVLRSYLSFIFPTCCKRPQACTRWIELESLRDYLREQTLAAVRVTEGSEIQPKSDVSSVNPEHALI